VDIIISGSSFAARSFPPLGVTYYPFTFRDADHLLAYTKSDVFKELTGGYRGKTGHKITAVTYYGVRHTSSNRAFKTCAEMKGLKIRVPDVPAYLAMPRVLRCEHRRRSPSPRSISRSRTARSRRRKIR